MGNYRNMCWSHKNFRGERNINAKLTNEQAAELRTLAATKAFTQTQLAEMFGITQGNVSQIIQGKSYKVKSNEANPEEIQ